MSFVSCAAVAVSTTEGELDQRFTGGRRARAGELSGGLAVCGWVLWRFREGERESGVGCERVCLRSIDWCRPAGAGSTGPYKRTGTCLPSTPSTAVIQLPCCARTTLAAGAGGLTTLVIIKLRDHVFGLLTTLNGRLAGLVSITACWCLCRWMGCGRHRRHRRLCLRCCSYAFT